MTSPPPPLHPKITQPWLVPFREWAVENRRIVDCMHANLRTVLEGSGATSCIAFDWNAMRGDLERYLYRTGHSRFRSFRKHARAIFGPPQPRFDEPTRPR